MSPNSNRQLLATAMHRCFFNSWGSPLTSTPRELKTRKWTELRVIHRNIGVATRSSGKSVLRWQTERVHDCQISLLCGIGEETGL